MRSWQYALIALGVLEWVIAVFLMVEGSILGEDYWYINPAGDIRNVHNAHHIPACIDVGEI